MLKYKFVKWEANDNGDNFLNNEFCKQLFSEQRLKYSCCYDSLLSHGIIKRGGYCYNFTDILKKFVYKTNYGIYEGYAPNKTLLRKNIGTKCYYILEVK